MLGMFLFLRARKNLCKRFASNLFASSYPDYCPYGSYRKREVLEYHIGRDFEEYVPFRSLALYRLGIGLTAGLDKACIGFSPFLSSGSAAALLGVILFNSISLFLFFLVLSIFSVTL